MVNIVMFYAFMSVSTCWVWRDGGEPERLVAALAVGAAVATSLLPFQHHQTFHEIRWGAFAIDTIFLATLLVVASFANRFWPIWFAAIQLLTVMIHLAVTLDHEFVPIIYERISGQLAYPSQCLLIVGAVRHRKRSAEFDWSWQAATRHR